jgi:prepilin-type N-terminal cleavage/methylation domain-containing protein
MTPGRGGAAAACKNARRMHFLPLVGRFGLEEPAGMPSPRNFNFHAVLARRRPPSAFTLVELLVVIAILAILVSLAFPFVRNSIAAGDRAACVQNLKALHAGVMLFAADNNGQIPSGNGGEGNKLPAFRTALQPYIRGMPGGTDDRRTLSYWHCRACLRARSVNFREPSVTYGYNGRLGYQGAPKPEDRRLMRLNEIPSPGKTMMIMDGRYASTAFWTLEVGPGKNRRPQEPEDFVHRGKINAIYVDGSAGAVGPGDLPPTDESVFWNPKGVVP